MSRPETPRRVGMLAPMQIELDPVVRALAMAADGDVHRGRVGEVEVLALLTTIGMAPATHAARRILDLGVDHVMVVGIAGGVDPRVAIGDVVTPELVVDRAAGTSHRPSTIATEPPRGVLSCGDDLILDPGELAAMAAAGVVAVDMETAAVAAVCEAAGCPWSVFRAISDRPGEGLVDEGLLALTRPDGTADPDALTRYLAERPEQMDALARLAHDTARATEAAAAAAIRACRAL